MCGGRLWGAELSSVSRGSFRGSIWLRLLLLYGVVVHYQHCYTFLDASQLGYLEEYVHFYQVRGYVRLYARIVRYGQGFVRRAVGLAKVRCL